MQYKKYQRKGLSEMASVKEFLEEDEIINVSVSQQDKLLSEEEFMLGYVARNPNNHADKWYVAKKYFDDNLVEVSEDETPTSPGEFGLLHLGRGSFGQAIDAAKKGHKVARTGWNGSGMYAVIMPGYPEGIEVNEATQKAHNLQPGTKLTFRPYWQLYTAQHDVAMWSPSGSDSLATDWVLVQ